MEFFDIIAWFTVEKVDIAQLDNKLRNFFVELKVLNRVFEMSVLYQIEHFHSVK